MKVCINWGKNIGKLKEIWRIQTLVCTWNSKEVFGSLVYKKLTSGKPLENVISIISIKFFSLGLKKK